MSDNYQRLLSRAANQHGVFSRSDAREFGVPRSSLFAATQAGKLHNPFPGVFTVAGSPSTRLQQLAALVYSVPGLAAASHDTAAAIWGLTDRGVRSFHVVVSRWDRVPRPGASFHESLDLVDEDVVRHKGLPLTTPERTVVDLGATNRWLVERALEQGIRKGLLRLEDVRGVVDRVGRRGRRGVGVIRPLLDQREKWDLATDSALEDAFRKLVADAGLPRPVQQFVLRDMNGDFVCRADFAYAASRVLIELDSEAHHMDRVTFRRDRSKQNRAVVLGWTVLRFTWWDLEDDPSSVIAQIRALVLDRRPA